MAEGQLINLNGGKRIDAAQKKQRASRQSEKFTEDALADLFEQAYAGRLIYAHMHGRWYIRDEGDIHFKEDLLQQVPHKVREFLRALNEANDTKLGSAAIINAVERLASRSPAMAIVGSEMDSDPHLLGTPGSVIDLRTGEATTDIGNSIITKQTSIAPAPGRPVLWLRFLEEATGNDAELIGYLQRLAGYCLTGETREESLNFFHGQGGNGKGVFLGTLKDIGGDYGQQASTEVLMESKSDRHPADLAALAGARMVVASESSDGKRWDEQRIKALTGRDEITARFMRENFFTFKPQFKILVASNHKPRIRTVDDAWRRRLHLVPFDKKPAQPDPSLKDRLKAEYPQILQWAIEGAEWWYREGLMTPGSIAEATEQYFKEEDLIGIWAEECIEFDPKAKASRLEVYASYESWCKQMGHGAATIYAMTRWFKARGFGQDMKNKKRPILGIRLKAPEDELQFSEP